MLRITEIIAKARNDSEARKREAAVSAENTTVMTVSTMAASAIVERARRREAGPFLEAMDLFSERESMVESDMA